MIRNNDVRTMVQLISSILTIRIGMYSYKGRHNFEIWFSKAELFGVYPAAVVQLRPISDLPLGITLHPTGRLISTAPPLATLSPLIRRSHVKKRARRNGQVEINLGKDMMRQLIEWLNARSLFSWISFPPLEPQFQSLFG